MSAPRRGSRKDPDHREDGEETETSIKQGNTGVVLVQQGGAAPGAAKVAKAATKAKVATPKKHGQWTDRRGKFMICFHCMGNHPVLECNDIPLKERERERRS